MLAVHVLIEQHQHAGLLDRAAQHELEIGGAGIARLAGPEQFAVAASAEVGGEVHEERPLQPLGRRLVQQPLHQGGHGLLQPAPQLRFRPEIAGRGC